jgi:putative MATE family efflux protein
MLSVEDSERNLHVIQGPLWQVIWVLTWPIVINMVAFAIGTLVDTWVVGRLGSDAQAAMGICWQMRYFMMMLTMALQVGATALVSRYYGARDMINTIEAARQSLIWGGIFAILSACIGIPTCRGLLHLLGASSGVEEQGWHYLKLALVANIPSTLLWTTQSIFRAIGRTRIAMTTTIVGTVFVILFDLIFCIYPFQMGIAGVGLSWIIAGFIAFIWNVFQLAQSEVKDCLNIIQAGLSKEWFLRIMKIGIPGCIQDVAVILGSFGLFFILAHTDQPAINQAAWGIGSRLEELIVLTPLFALNVAISIIVGQNLGANQPERAQQAGWKMALAAVIFSSIIAILFYIFAPNIASAMSNDPAVVKATINYFYLIAWTEPFCIWFVFTGAMQGAGYTKIPMIITIVCFCVLRLGLAWYLTVNINLGANGTWIATAISSVIAAIWMTLLFKFGKWKEQKV